MTCIVMGKNESTKLLTLSAMPSVINNTNVKLAFRSASYVLQVKKSVPSFSCFTPGTQFQLQVSRVHQLGIEVSASGFDGWISILHAKKPLQLKGLEAGSKVKFCCRVLSYVR